VPGIRQRLVSHLQQRGNGTISGVRCETRSKRPGASSGVPPLAPNHPDLEPRRATAFFCRIVLGHRAWPRPVTCSSRHRLAPAWTSNGSGTFPDIDANNDGAGRHCLQLVECAGRRRILAARSSSQRRVRHLDGPYGPTRLSRSRICYQHGTTLSVSTLVTGPFTATYVARISQTPARPCRLAGEHPVATGRPVLFTLGRGPNTSKHWLLGQPLNNIGGRTTRCPYDGVGERRHHTSTRKWAS